MMSDDSFIREVNEEMRRAQAQAIWDRFGPATIVLAILIVLGTAIYVAYDYWDRSRANASGDKFSQALLLANQNKSDEAIAALKDLEDAGYGAYPILARMRTATELVDKADFKGAVAGFDAVAADTAIPMAIRDMARLRAAFVLVDNGSVDEVSTRVQPMLEDTNPLRHSAREALALADWKAGKAADALKLFDQIGQDEAAPRNTRERANVMGELIRGSGDAS